MKRLLLLLSFFMLISAPSSAIDVQDFLGSDTNGFGATGLDRIRNAMEENANGMGNPFTKGIQPGAVQSPSAVKAIMDDFITKGLVNPYDQETGDLEAGGDDSGEEANATDNDLPFFSGEGTGLFNPPEEAPGGEWFASPNDDWGWFYWPDDSDVWFDPGFWSEESQ
ncbi:MAG: hypothetical protein SWE60_25080 [Thermodesulfobacteriota bacterium]|nr:hypothetical protein [Thermodesulfobacteriota bacterium]